MPPPNSRARAALLILGIWSVPACVGAAGRFLEWRFTDSTAPLGATLFAGAMPWLTWALLTPVVLGAARRRPLQLPPTAGTLGFHVAASLVVGHVYMSAGMTWVRVETGRPLAQVYFQFMPIILPLGVIGYWAIVVLANWREANRRLAERTLVAARAESQLSRARLDALQAQVNPHFLFNTLNSISALVRGRDDARATAMIARLGGLLRRTLSVDQRRELSLAEELELTRDYLAIEQERLGDRLVVVLDTEPGLEQAQVPNMLLQPLVENAILHGVAPVETPCRLELSATREGDTLVLRIANEGAPCDTGGGRPGHGGLGLVNVRARLVQHYAEAATLTVEPLDGGGCVVCVRLPCRMAPAPVAGEAGQR